MLLTTLASTMVGLSYIGIATILYYSAFSNGRLPNRNLYWLFGSLLFFGGVSRIMDSFGEESFYYVVTLLLAGTIALPTFVLTYLAMPEMLAARPVQELLAANLRFRLLVDSISDYAIFLLDPQGNICSWNSGAERLKGYKESEIIGKHLRTFYTPEDVAIGHPEEVIEMARKNGRYAEEGWRVKKDGTKFWAYITLTSVRTEDGKLAGFAKVTRDLSERKVSEEEMKKLNSLLRLRMQALEAFNNSVCHDLNAPLRAMDGFTQALNEDFAVQLEKEPIMRDYLLRVQKATNRMKNLVRDLMRLSQVSHDNLKPSIERFSITELVWDIVREEKSYPEHEKHRIEVQPWMMAEGDPALIRLLLQNLLANAFKFSSKASCPVIQVGKIGDEFFVSDNGIGFQQEKADLLFKPFSRLHAASEYPGTGIGLTICKRVVEIHDGSIRAEGRCGEGAKFFFTLGNKETGVKHGS